MEKYKGEPLDILHTIGMDELYPIIRIAFKISGPFKLDKFKKAIMECAKVVPELFCKYELSDNSFVTVTESVDDILFENIDPDKDIANWDLFKDPQLRIYLNKSKNYQVTIFLSHILTDGAGAKQFLYLLSQAYNTGDLSNVTNHNDIDWLKELLKKHQIKSDRKADHPTHPLSLPRISNYEKQVRRTNFFTLDEEESAALIKAAHEAKVTLNDVFMAAFGQAVQRLSFTKKLSLACPVDMRKFIPEKDQVRIANHTSRYNISVDSDLNKPFEVAISNVHKAMQKNKDDYQCLQSVQSLISNYDHEPLKKLQQLVEDNYHVRDIAYTNFGIISEKAFNFSGCDISDFYMLGSYRRMPMFQVAVSTYCGKIYFSYAMIGNDREALLGDSVVRSMRDLIRIFYLKHGNI